MRILSSCCFAPEKAKLRSLALANYNTPNPQSTLGFIFDVVHSMDLDKCTVTCIHYKTIQNIFTGEPRGFSRVTAGFSSYDGEFRLPLVLTQASPIFHSSCEGKLGIALE